MEKFLPINNAEEKRYEFHGGSHIFRIEYIKTLNGEIYSIERQHFLRCKGMVSNEPVAIHRGSASFVQISKSYNTVNIGYF